MISVDELTEAYIRLNNKLQEETTKHENIVEDLKHRMKLVKAALLDQFEAAGIDSISTRSAVAYKTVNTRYWTNDWDAFNRFIVEYNAPQLLEKRINQGNMKTWMEEVPGAVPPGVNVSSEYRITIRPKKAHKT